MFIGCFFFVYSSTSQMSSKKSTLLPNPIAPIKFYYGCNADVFQQIENIALFLKVLYYLSLNHFLKLDLFLLLSFSSQETCLASRIGSRSPICISRATCQRSFRVCTLSTSHIRSQTRLPQATGEFRHFYSNEVFIHQSIYN